MELVPTPRRRVRRPSPVVLTAVVLFALAALVLAPQALGLRHGLVRDGAMGSTWGGAVVVVADEPGTDLRVGDVITFVPPRRLRAGGPSVTRRVDGIADDVIVTRADGAATVDPWRLGTDATYPRVVGRAPYVGRVLEGGTTTHVALVSLAALLLVTGLAGLLAAWPGTRRRPGGGGRGAGRRAGRPRRPAGVG